MLHRSKAISRHRLRLRLHLTPRLVEELVEVSRYETEALQGAVATMKLACRIPQFEHEFRLLFSFLRNLLLHLELQLRRLHHDDFGDALELFIGKTGEDRIDVAPIAEILQICPEG